MEEGERRTRFKIEPLLGGVALLLLLVGCVVVLRPFLTALMWAIVLSYSLYPLQRRFTVWFRGSRTLAACFVTLSLTLILAGPVVLIGLSLVEDGRELAGATKKWFLSTPKDPPAWLEGIPIVGPEAAGYWTEFSEDRKRWVEEMEKGSKLRKKHEEEPEPVLLDDFTMIEPTAGEAAAPEKSDSSRMFLLLGRTFGMAREGLAGAGIVVRGVTQVFMSAFLAFFFLRDAPFLADRLKVGAERLAGARGRHLLKVAGDTVRGVVYGILGTAITQALVAGLGFWIAGVPGAMLLGVLTFFCALIPFGPPIVWIPATLWLFTQGSPGWGVFLLLWGLLGISGVDNFVRPLIISQGSKMPFVLIFCGVIGGALAFGLVGLFLGPTLLAVAYRIVDEWSMNPKLAVPVEIAKI